MAAVIQFCLDSVDSFANRTTSQVRKDIKSMRRAPDPNNANATIGVTVCEEMTIHRISKYGKLLILVQRTHTPALGTISFLLVNSMMKIRISWKGTPTHFLHILQSSTIAMVKS
ncbi:unnamed protein product [Cylindrotheca closterium]|uniref:Uncharacterized protein n=1 Tax=Cylindrotheca closterium TaxID=2856 RepID=A0AAD2FMM3_9STRA|nr:unnamed protein product [Cylindrotheca closterium]